MTRLFNDPAKFADETVNGFVAAHRRWVRRVPGGVARSTATPAGQVAVIIGGGSGHYPAFAALVGQGLASGAVMGNVFASPSAAQVVSVAKAAQHGGGVLLSYGNHAGDYLNFSQAEERLRNGGIACRSVQVTDDIIDDHADELGRIDSVAGDGDHGIGMQRGARAAATAAREAYVHGGRCRLGVHLGGRRLGRPGRRHLGRPGGTRAAPDRRPPRGSEAADRNRPGRGGRRPRGSAAKVSS